MFACVLAYVRAVLQVLARSERVSVSFGGTVAMRARRLGMLLGVYISLYEDWKQLSFVV